MKISELISHLEELKEKYGDLPIRMCWDEFHWSFDQSISINEIWTAEFMKDHYLIAPTSEGSKVIDYKKI